MRPFSRWFRLVSHGLILWLQECIRSGANKKAPCASTLRTALTSNAQLLYAQHWAFLSSVLTSNEGKRLFAPIAGLGSIGSTFCAGLVSHIVGRIALTGLMYLAACCYLICASLSEYAFVIAGRGHFAPKMKDIAQDGSITTTNGGNRSPYKGSTFDQAMLLFRRVPVLRALFVEIIISQSLSSLVNFIFLLQLKSSITSDELRAGWSGNFCAYLYLDHVGTSDILTNSGLRYVDQWHLRDLSVHPDTLCNAQIL